MMDKTMLKRLRTQLGMDEAVEITDKDVELAQVLVLMAQREMIKVFYDACYKNPTASAVWVAKKMQDIWLNQKDLDDGKEEPRIILR